MSSSARSMPESDTENSQVVPALMLAAIVALTGFEAVLVFAGPDKAAVHPATHPVRLATRRSAGRGGGRTYWAK